MRPSSERAADDLQIGLCVLPDSMHHAARIARDAEEQGASWFAVCDSPVHHADPHAVIHAALRETASLRVGTMVTNPVTRHWSAQAGVFRTLEELAPDRPFMGISTGDTAVIDAGLRPASVEELAEYVGEFRGLSSCTPVLVAAGGPKSVGRAARYADELVLGQGFTEPAVNALRAVAEEAAAAHGLGAPPLWLFVIGSFVARREQEALARSDVRAWVLGQAAQAFSGSLKARGVDPTLGDRIKRSLRARSETGFDREPGNRAEAEIENYLFDRYAVAGIPEESAERILAAVEATGLRRVFITLFADDIDRAVGLATSRFLPRLLA